MSRAIPADTTTPGIVARYMTRPPITPDLSAVSAQAGRILGGAGSAQVIYRSDKVHPRHQANFRAFDPLDFLAEVSAHIPDAHEKTTLFYGWYSNRTRGYRKRHGLLGAAPPVESVSEEVCRVAMEARRSWARLIRQVYEVDPLVCARCGGTMKIIAVIERPAVVRQILDHLGLPAVTPSLRAPPDAPDGLASDHPRDWSYEPCFDDLPVPDSVMA